MPFCNKIKPIVSDGVINVLGFPPAIRQKPKARLKQLFERQFSLKNLLAGDQSPLGDDSNEFEPSSVCLRKLVQNYIEDPNSGKQWCGGRNSCNNCRGNDTDSSSDEEEEDFGGFLQSIKNLLFYADISEEERNLGTKTTNIIEKSNCDSQLKTLVDELVNLGYDAAICKSRWEKSGNPVCFAGEYEYLDVMIGKERVLIDVDFKSNFEIARPTTTYQSILQTFPYVFVGQMDRLKQVAVVMSKAAKKSMKKNGLLVPPWRTPNYVLIKWLAFYIRDSQIQKENNRDIRIKI